MQIFAKCFGKLGKKSPKFDFPQFNRSDLFFLLTAVFFETGAMFTPTKSGNGTNCGSRGLFQSYLTHSQGFLPFQPF